MAKKPKRTASRRAAPARAAAPRAAPSSALAVVLDGRSLDDAQARQIWLEFSRHMDEHEGDLDGFARIKGWASVKPEHRAGQAVLVGKSQA
jgi:hypothetical protein